MVKLVEDTIGKNDIDKLIEWLKTYPRLTKGPKTVEKEEDVLKVSGIVNRLAESR